MEVMNDLVMPNKETIYFYDKIVPWLKDEQWTDETETCMQVIFKHDVPVDIINSFLICRPKLRINYSSHYIIAGK